MECDKASQCFQQLFPSEREFINDKKIQLTYYQSENLFKQGAFSPYVMYIVEGLVRLFLQTGPNKYVNIALATTGEFLAFSSLFGEDVYYYSAAAIKDSRICMIDKLGLKQLLKKNSEFAMQITAKNCRYESHLLGLIRNISYKQMHGKLASALLYLSNDKFIEKNVFRYLTRQDIAAFACISTESTSKFLKEFEKEGIIELNGRDIRVLDRRKLEEIDRKG